MGLDMFLKGHKLVRWDEPCHEMDGYRVEEFVLDLGYWRKHPNLHGYIVQNFAGGVDECQTIQLSISDLMKILAASEEDGLPTTTGFFFGASRPEDKQHTKQVLEKAIEWLRKSGEDKHHYRWVTYQASW